MDFAYSEIEGLLADLHAVVPSKRAALRARFKHLQRLGFPTGANTGKGRRASYSVEQVFQLALAFEMMQLGLTPERVVAILALNWDVACDAIGQALNPAPDAERWYLYCDPQTLHCYQDRDDDDADPSEPTFFLASGGQLGHLLVNNSLDGRAPRLSLIYVTGLVYRLRAHLEAAGRLGFADFYVACGKWLAERQPSKVLTGQAGGNANGDRL